MIMRSRFGTVALLLAAGAGLSAQEVTGTITGTVRDAKGSAVGGASLRLVSVGGVQARTLTTDAQGNYRVPLLLPGEYTLTVTKEGFITAKAEFRVTGGGVVRQDIDLKSVGTSSATVEVVSTAAQVDKTQTKTASTFTQDSFAEIPLSGNFASRALAGLALAPAVTGNQLYQSIRGGGQGQTQYLVNGLSVRDNITMQGRPQDVILDDLVEESQIILSPLNAKYGDSSAGLINIVEKTGGNEFTGTMRIRLDRANWTARRPSGYSRAGSFNNAEGPSSDDLSRTYEFSVTGPIIKDRLTFVYGTRLAPTSLSTAIAGNLGASTFAFRSPAAGGTVAADLNGAVYGQPASGPTKSTFHQGRLFWQLNVNHSLDYSHSENFNQNFDYMSNYPTVLAPSEIDYDQHSLNRFRQLTYRGLIAGTQVLEIRYGKRESTIKFPTGPGTPIQVWYGPTGMTSYTQANSTRWWGGATGDNQSEIRNTESATINYQLIFEAGGTHSVDLGVNYFKTIWGTVQNSGGPNGVIVNVPGKIAPGSGPLAGGGYVVFPWNTSSPAQGFPTTPSLSRIPYMQQYVGVQQAELDKPTRAYYINDLWTINNSWSLMAGLRLEQFKYMDGIGERYKSSTLSPRAELKWDIEGNQKRIVSLSYGEFRGNVGERITRQQSVYRRSTVVTRRWTTPNPVPGTADWIATQAQVLDQTNYGYIASIDDPSVVYDFDRNFKPERNKETVLGFRRSYATGGFLTINLVNRTWDDLPQSIGSVDPVQVSDPFGSPTVFNNYKRTLVNDPGSKRNYRAVEMEFRAPFFDKKMTIGGSYTYARATANSNYGDSTGFALTQNQAIAGLFRDGFHTLGIGSDTFEPNGPLPTSIGNSLRMIATYSATRGGIKSVVSFTGRYQDGSPEDQVITVTIPGSTATASGLNPSFPTPPAATPLPQTYGYYYGGRGQFTSPHSTLFDFGWTLEVPINKKISSFMELSVINVFNHIYPGALSRAVGGQQASPIGYRVSSSASYGYPTSFSSFVGARDINLNFGFRF